MVLQIKILAQGNYEPFREVRRDSLRYFYEDISF